ncbi:MAG: NF038143 family protein [Proteobacteria bacterium]|nr:NF038143 family protein [Pseudomonadota bacterium]
MTKTVDRKYAAIRRRERGIAQTIAGGLIGARKVSVWEVLIPIVFIVRFAGIQKRRELFVGNFLYTKHLALDGARKIMRNNAVRKEVLGAIDEQTKRVLVAHTAGVYSEAIRACQMKEVRLLLDHFVGLFRADGLAYPDLVLSAYGRYERYEAFLKQLQGIEDEVYRTSCETLGEQADTAFIDKVRESTGRIRVHEAELIFKDR